MGMFMKEWHLPELFLSQLSFKKSSKWSKCFMKMLKLTKTSQIMSTNVYFAHPSLLRKKGFPVKCCVPSRDMQIIYSGVIRAPTPLSCDAKMAEVEKPPHFLQSFPHFIANSSDETTAKCGEVSSIYVIALFERVLAVKMRFKNSKNRANVWLSREAERQLRNSRGLKMYPAWPSSNKAHFPTGDWYRLVVPNMFFEHEYQLRTSFHIRLPLPGGLLRSVNGCWTLFPFFQHPPRGIGS